MARKDRFRVEALRDFLCGAWRVEREILDRRADLVGSFNGSVTFGPDDGGLRCREEGRMVLGGYSGLAHRDYLYGFPSPHRAEVRFADGRAFHGLDLSTGCWTAVYLCPPDRYEGRFEAQGEDRWLTIWEITGPGKAARLSRLHTR